jgi:nitrogen regulatory protein P-II 1
MVHLIALVKPFRVASVLRALGEAGVEPYAGTVREVMGFGRQKNRLRRYLGSEYSTSFVPKVEIGLFVRDADAEPAVRALVGSARSGRMGDGKVLVVRGVEPPVGIMDEAP